MSEELIRTAAWDLVSDDVEKQKAAYKIIKEYAGKAARVVLEVAHEWDIKDQRKWLGMWGQGTPTYSLISAITGEDAIDALSFTLSDPNSLFRAFAVFVLSEIDNPLVPDLLFQVFEDTDVDVRANAVYGFQQLGDQRSHDFVIKALYDSDEKVRLRAIWAMRWVAGVEGVGILINLLQDPSSKVVYKVISTLRRLNPEEAIEPIMQLLDSEGVDIVENAIYALGKMGVPRAIEPIMRIALSNAKGTTLLHALEALVELDPRSAADAGAVLMKHNEPLVRDYAVDILDRLHIPQETDIQRHDKGYLDDLLESDDLVIKRKSIEALLRVRNPLAVEPLVDLILNSKEARQLTDEILAALVQIGTEEAVSALTSLMHDEWRGFVISSKLAKIGYEPGIENLCAIMESDIDRAFTGCILNIGRINHPRIHRLLISMLDHPIPRFKTAAIHQLCESTGPAIEQLIQPFLQDPDYRIQTATLIGLNERKMRKRMAEFHTQAGLKRSS